MGCEYIYDRWVQLGRVLLQGRQGGTPGLHGFDQLIVGTYTVSNGGMPYIRK